MSRFQNSELLPKGKVFQEEVTTSANGLGSQDKQKPHDAQHEASLARRQPQGES